MQNLGHAAHLPSSNSLSGGCLSDGLLHPSFLNLPERRLLLELRFVLDPFSRAALTSFRTLKRFCLFFHSAGSR